MAKIYHSVNLNRQANKLKLCMFFSVLTVASSSVIAQTKPATPALNSQVNLGTASSQIAMVKLYPGSATVVRTARINSTMRKLTFSCLPMRLDPQSLQVSADANVRIGEVTIENESRQLHCANTNLENKIQALLDQQADIQAQIDANNYVTSYLKAVASTNADRKELANNVGQTSDALLKNGQAALLKINQLQRQHEALNKQLEPLLAERGRTQRDPNIQNVSVNIYTDRDADVQLTYQVAGPGWTPAYRATLDSKSDKVKIERLAMVAQNTGEDWREAKLTLSTGQPNRSVSGAEPRPWQIGIQAPPPVAAEVSGRMAPMAMMAAPAPAPMAIARGANSKAIQLDAPPLFDASVFQGGYATEFQIPQRIDIPSNGQKVALSLGQTESAAKLSVRASPSMEPAAYLTATLAQPEGVWPRGEMRLFRDGAFVGSSYWQPSSAETLSLSFGQDELVTVVAAPQKTFQSTTGLTGSTAQQTIERHYTVENRHKTPVLVQVLEASPTAVDERVKVKAQFTPEVSEKDWRKNPGVVMWEQTLAPSKRAAFDARYLIEYDKDLKLEYQ